MSSLTCIIVMVLVLKVWTPKTIMRLEGDKPATLGGAQAPPAEMFMAWVPYLLLVVFVLVVGRAPISSRPSTVGDSMLPPFLPVRWDRPLAAPDGARTAQPDYARPPRGARSRRPMPRSTS